MTQELYNNEGNEPINRAEEHIRDALGDDSEHSVTLHVQRDRGESAPTQTVGTSFTTDDKACGRPSKGDYYYDTLGEWWADYTACHCQGDDACVLITNAVYSDDSNNTVGECYNNYACVCELGPFLANLSEGETGQGSGNKYSAANTVLHEIGHAIIGGFVNEHKVYNSYKGGNGNWGVTAMKTNAVSVNENACGESVHSHSQEATGYSECAEDKM